MTVAGQFVGEGAHITGALHVVLPAHGVNAHALAAYVAGEHGEVSDAHNGGRALAVFGNAQAVVNSRVTTGGKQTGGGTNVGGGDACDAFGGFR